jgi:hypothetical protein
MVCYLTNQPAFDFFFVCYFFSIFFFQIIFNRDYFCHLNYFSSSTTDIRIGDFNLDIIPFDDDVISLGLDNFRELFLDGDESSLHTIARSIMKLQSMFGYIPNLKAKGNRAAVSQCFFLFFFLFWFVASSILSFFISCKQQKKLPNRVFMLFVFADCGGNAQTNA